MNHMFNNIHGISPAYLKEDISLVGKGGLRNLLTPFTNSPHKDNTPTKTLHPNRCPATTRPPNNQPRILTKTTTYNPHFHSDSHPILSQPPPPPPKSPPDKLFPLTNPSLRQPPWLSCPGGIYRAGVYLFFLSGKGVVRGDGFLRRRGMVC